MTESANRCFFCGGCDVRLAYGGGFHKRKKDHGPFDLYQCVECGSAITLPPPSPALLARLYDSFAFGMPQRTRALLAENPDAAWHDMSARRLVGLIGRSQESSFTWIDVGAGAGELAARLARHFPAARGIALDIHDRPPELAASTVEWRRVDIADSAWPERLEVRADLVYATGVWEHVPRPDIFARNVLSLLAPGGTLYMTTPNYASLMRRILGRHWPYYNPGEHICMPTPRGARLCLHRQVSALLGPDASADIAARPILIQYAAGFVLAKLGIPACGKVLPRWFRVHLPSGALEAVVRLKA
jgi:SAM-dependent methyltransferase